MGDMAFQPLTDIWSTYNESLDVAVDRGLIDDPELAEDYVWPVDLGLYDSEQDDIKQYIQERMSEVMERTQSERGLDPNLVAAYLFRSVICGMLWEHERIGR